MNPVEEFEGCMKYMEFKLDMNEPINIEDEIDIEDFCINMRDWLYDNIADDNCLNNIMALENAGINSIFINKNGTSIIKANK